MSNGFEVKLPLPSRKSAEALREQIIEYFVGVRPAVGQRFLSDHELARVAKLSRPTVRRALDDLRKEGWIERRHGRGTYVGPRAAMAVGSAPRRAEPGLRSVARLAVLVHQLGDFSHDWYSPAVLAGIDDAAAEQAVTLEILGDRASDVKSISARLMQSRPDVFVCTAPAARHAMLIGEAQRQDIPVVGTGTYLMDLGIPTVCEDGAAGAARAVEYLAQQGHTRIGFVQMAFTIPLVFLRHQGYLTGLRRAGFEEDESLVLWLRWGDRAEQVDRLRRYLKRCRPTAIVCGSCWPLEFLADLIAAGEVRVPHDVSVINFDQHPRAREWLGGIEPTTLALPLRAMGRKVAEMARKIVDGHTVESTTLLPCDLVRGASVTAITPEGQMIHSNPENGP
jgi:LacI family transcriptional regulator